MSITKWLAKRFSNYNSPNSLGSRLRARRIIPLVNMVRDVYLTQGEVKILDVGGTRAYWKIVPEQFLEDYRVTITLLNLPGSTGVSDEKHFRFIEGDGCDLGLPDNSFDMVHSNSVIEHVGDWTRMVSFAHEIRRMAPKYFVQTPNYWFPLEPHCWFPFFHWLPKPIRVWLILHFSLGHWRKANSVDEAVLIVESARLLNRAMLQSLFPDAYVLTERFLGLPKSLIAIRE